MSLRQFAAPRLRHSLLFTSLLLAGSFSAHAAEEMLRKAVGKEATAPDDVIRIAL